MKKRLQTCWPATVSLRGRFLAPRSYSHRSGHSARYILSATKQRVAAVARRNAERDEGVFADWASPTSVPRRALDLLYRANVGLDDRRTGITFQAVRDLYDISAPELSRLVTVLQTQLNDCQWTSSDRHSTPLTSALFAITQAVHIIGPEPILP